MDYKEVAETVKWHAMHSGLNGAEGRVMCFAATSAEYKTGTLQASYAELAESVGLSVASAVKAIAALVDKKALQVVRAASGRMPATYRVLSARELNAYFCIEEANPDYRAWDKLMNSQFYELDSEHDAIGAGCEDCTDENMCPMHEHQKKMFEQKIEWRDRALWMANNKKPPMSRTTIHGRAVGGSPVPYRKAG